jgi:hypothetical protein
MLISIINMAAASCILWFRISLLMIMILKICSKTVKSQLKTKLLEATELAYILQLIEERSCNCTYTFYIEMYAASGSYFTN